MQSMIKRKVDISITAHVELICQLVSDAYTLHIERYVNKNNQGFTLNPGNFLYYRMSRQTGHSAALKKLLSKKFETENDSYVFAIFHSERERKNFLSPSRDADTGIEYPSPDFDTDGSTAVLGYFRTEGLPPNKANILVFSDTLHDTRRMAYAQLFLKTYSDHFPNLALVVFLG
ncbi:hypothetical protein DEEACLCL_00087 [Salmonella phage CRW-SP2]|nr:hypothetical protein DEEACLCL_00087 [Salmonella phage CRW-SP2]